MKTAFLFVLMLSSISALARETGLLSSEVVRQTEEMAPLPFDLSFSSPNFRVLNESWFISLFAENCAQSLSGAEPSAVEIHTKSGSSIELKINGITNKAFSAGAAAYIPVYYYHGRPIHPHYRIKLPGWVTLHLQIHKANGQKQMTLSVLIGKGRDMKVVPVFEADGI